MLWNWLLAHLALGAGFGALAYAFALYFFPIEEEPTDAP